MRGFPLNENDYIRLISISLEPDMMFMLVTLLLTFINE